MIKLENITKIYKASNVEKKALDGLSLIINDGEFVAIKGKSGSGKSTLLNIIGCMDTLSEGTYFLDDEDISIASVFKLDKIRKNKISFIFQSYELVEQYTVYENIEIPLLAAKVSPKLRKKKINAIMEQLGIGGLAKKYPKQISGGEQQRTAIARALVSNNQYILADEPTGALDQENSKELMKIFTEIHKMGKTIIIVTHDDDIAAYADRIVIIADGKTVE